MTATLEHATPQQVIDRLAAIECDLAEKQNDYEQAADDRARTVRDWEKRLARARVNAKGGDAEARKASALLAAADTDDLYDRLLDAEARYDALKVVVRVLETRASIGQSILRAQGRA